MIRVENSSLSYSLSNGGMGWSSLKKKHDQGNYSALLIIFKI